jgi:hypothetical protein
MSRNTALVTDAAKIAAQQDLDDYAAGAAAHMGGDWSGHVQMRVHAATNFTSTESGILSDTVTRMQLTDDAGVDYAVITPTFYVGAASTSVPPLIAIQPQSQSVATGQAVTLRVYAASPLTMTYQWQFKHTGSVAFSDISGANASTYAILSASSDNAGDYKVVVSNAYGSVTSDTATLTVT